jgi:hypothetical protein
MEEGFMLVFPELVLEGQLANQDFLHLYGPGSLWVLAGVFKAFGTSLEAQRLVALLQQVGIVFGVFGLARYWGRTVALGCGLASLIIIVPPIGLTALAWVGGVALGTLGLLTALESRRAPPDPDGDDRRGRRLALIAGLLFGAALLYRLDLVVAVGLGALVVLRGMDPARTRRLVLGAAIGVSPYLIHLATAGPYTVFKGMVLDPVIYLRGGRRLPIPPPPGHLDGFLQRAGAIDQLDWDLPTLRTSAQLTVWFFFLLGTVATLLLVGRWLTRRDPGAFTPRVVLAVAFFSVGLLPQAIQRVDSAHFAWVSCVPVAFLPVAVYEVLKAKAPRLSARRRSLVAGSSVLVFLFVVIPHFTWRTYTDFVVQTFGVHRIAYEIEFDGRRFYYGRPDVADAARPLLEDAARISEPGDRLFVGPTDLTKTPYSDAYLYYLLDELDPATYFIEMDPGVANRDGSRMADDLASADIVILSAVWLDWSEPNDSRNVGSDEPVKVLEEQFCLVGEYDGLYELYERCDE